MAKPSALRVEEPIEPIEQNIESVDLSEIEIEEERRIEPSEKDLFLLRISQRNSRRTHI